MRPIGLLCGIFCLLLSTTSGWTTSADGSRLPESEELAYSVRWSRLPVVDATFRLEPTEDGVSGPVRRLIVEAFTKPLPSRIYRVDNRYETLLDVATGLPIRYDKNCDEAYFQEQATIIYAQASGHRLRRLNGGSGPSTQSLLGPTHNLFSALYFLRQHDFRGDEPVRFLLDAKGAYWNASARRRRNLRTAHGFVWEVAVRFTLATGDEQSRQSDLLTDNIVNGDRPLILHIHPPAPGTDEPPLVVHMEYRGGGFHLAADLQED